MTTTTQSDTIICRCSLCGKEQKSKPAKDGTPKLPRGWHRLPAADDFACKSCWHERYLMRACTMAIAEAMDAEKDELWKSARECWALSTSAANVAIHYLWKNDVVRTPAMEKLPPMPAVYLYPLVREAVPDLDPASVVSVLHAIEGKYREKRYETIWLRKAAPPAAKYPQPFPLRADCWEAYRDEKGGHPMVRARFAGRWWELRLRGGNEFRRQLGQHAQIVAREAVAVEAAFYPSGDGKRIMLKLCAWFPRKPQKERAGGTLDVRTGGGRFLTATIGDREPWHLNCDSIREKIANHEAMLQRTSEDLKHEKRWPRAQRERFLEDRRRRVEKQRNRLDTFCHETTRMLTNYAERQGANCVRLDTTDRSYLPSFPWFQWTEKLKQKLDESGILLLCERQGSDQTTEDRSQNPEQGETQ